MEKGLITEKQLRQAELEAKGTLEEVIESLDREKLEIKPGQETELKKLQEQYIHPW